MLHNNGFLPDPDHSGSSGPKSSRSDIKIEARAQGGQLAVGRLCEISPELPKVKEATVWRTSNEITRLEGALEEFRDRLALEISTHDEARGSDSFTNMATIANGKTLEEKLKSAIKEHRWTAAFAVQKVIDEQCSGFMVYDAESYRGIQSGLLEILTNRQNAASEAARISLESVEGDKIVKAPYLTPSLALQLRRPDVKGVILEGEVGHSHIQGILQRLGLPLVITISKMENLEVGETVIIDGTAGKMTLRPSENTLAQARAEIATYETNSDNLEASISGTARTLDGVAFQIGLDEDSPQTIAALGLKTGLYRTENTLMRRNGWCTEEEFYDEYSRLLGANLSGVTIRTFDLGGDEKRVTEGLQGDVPYDTGVRGIRLALGAHPEEFKSQMRALIRAGADHPGKLRILFPMVIDVGDFRAAKKVYNECFNELIAKGKIPDSDPAIQLGPMIETSAAVRLIKALVAEADFVSIGTSDLLHSTLDGDRNKGGVAFSHPAFLACMQDVILACNEVGVPCSICGGMPNTPPYGKLLVGLGAREITAMGTSIPRLIRDIEDASTTECEGLVRAIIDCAEEAKARKMLTDFLQKSAEASKASSLTMIDV